MAIRATKIAGAEAIDVEDLRDVDEERWSGGRRPSAGSGGRSREGRPPSSARGSGRGRPRRPRRGAIGSSHAGAGAAAAHLTVVGDGGLRSGAGAGDGHARMVATGGAGRRPQAASVGSSTMRTIAGLEALPLDEEPSVVTVGFFDGVHLGHRAVLARTVERRARARDPIGGDHVRPASARDPDPGPGASSPDDRRAEGLPDRRARHRHAGRAGVHRARSPGSRRRTSSPTSSSVGCTRRTPSWGRTSRSGTRRRARSPPCPRWERRTG